MNDFPQIREDILAAVDQQGFESGQYGAVNFDQIKAVVDKLDAFVQQASPVIATFSPAQYRAWVTSIAAVLHAATTEVDKFGGAHS